MKSQRGLIALPIWAYAAIGAAVVTSGSLVYAKIQSARLAAVTQEYAGFKAQVKANAELALQRKKAKEAEYAQNIKTALTDRDAALRKLRDQRAAASRVPILTVPAAPNSAICFDQTAISAAIERYRGRVRSLIESGDEALIDSKALLESWPR